MSKAVVVLSGGQDSTTCLLWAINNYDHVETITFYYDQRNHQEVDQARKIAKDLGVSNKLIRLDVLSDLTENAMTRSELDIVDGKVPNTFVPGRNQLFLTVAAIYAKSKGIKNLITGVSETDYSGYPDCRDEFIDALNVATNLAMDTDFEIITPLMWLDKTQIWELADRVGKLEYIRENTLTCYNGVIGDGCKQCMACNLRNKGLAEYLERCDKID